MRQKVKGNSITYYKNVNEHLDDYVEIFKPYFKSIAHHHHMHHTISKDAILIYSYFPIEVCCDGCRNQPIDFAVKRVSKASIPDTFFEMKHRDLECENVDRIYYGGRLVGFYCNKNNVFCCGDITHDGGQSVHIQAIISAMVEHGYLKVLNGKDKKTTVMLGADPEMETLINGELVSAFDLPQLCNRDKAYISHDGHTQPQRELRPDPAETPEELVENIRDLIKISSFFGENLSVMGRELPLGGHIHIGNVAPNPEIISVLDYFLSPFNEFNSSTRNSSKYGKKGDVRVQPHGFEYRTPPAAWLLTPMLALKTLQLTQNVVEKIINDIDIDISDNSNVDEYKENLERIGFGAQWIVEFLDEIAWAKIHISEPLAKTWNVEVPKDFQVKKLYRSKIQIRPSIPRPVRVGGAPSSPNIMIEDLEMVEEEEEPHEEEMFP